jgi:hypothetical protein
MRFVGESLIGIAMAVAIGWVTLYLTHIVAGF